MTACEACGHRAEVAIGIPPSILPLSILPDGFQVVSLSPGATHYLCAADAQLVNDSYPEHRHMLAPRQETGETENEKGGDNMGLTKFEVDAEGSLPPFITRDEVVAAELIECTVENGQKELQDNSNNPKKVNINVKARINGKLEKRTVALHVWQISQVAADHGITTPEKLGGKKIYLYPTALVKGPYKGTQVINASAEKPKA